MNERRISRRSFLQKSAAVSMGLMLAGCGPDYRKMNIRAVKPNVLFVHTRGRAGVSVGGRLAETGTTFTRAYNQGAWSDDVYACSEGMIHTGRFLWNAQKELSVSKKLIRPALWFDYFKQNGYDTYFSGDWSLGVEAEGVDIAVDDRMVIIRRRLERSVPFFAYLISDEQVERMIDVIEQSKVLSGSTCIVYVNGSVGDNSEGGIDQPAELIISGLNVSAGRRVDTPVYMQDAVPTVLELVDVAVPEHVQYRSLMPAIRGEYIKPYNAIYCAYKDVQRVVIKDEYKLVLYPQDETAFLYDLAADPEKSTNLIDRPENKTLTEKLLRGLFELQKETGDDLYLRSIYSNLLHCPVC